MNKRFNVIGVVLTILLLAVPVMAQETVTPAIDGVDQLSIDGTVTIARVAASAPGFVAIHADNGGTFGEVIGFAPVLAGENPLVLVPIDAARATPTLFAVLHTDAGQIGTFEEGADAPVTDANGQSVVDSFAVDALVVGDQIVDSQVNVASVTVAQPSWLVIYAGDNQTYTTPIGQTFLDPGTYANVPVTIDSAARTSMLWPVIHTDTGAAGEFEFGTVEGADVPLVLNDRTAALSISTTPSIRLANNQFTLGDNGVVSGNTATLTIQSILAEQPGFVVIYNEASNGGEVIGVAPVSAGTNNGVTVEIDATRITPNLRAELHADTGNVGEFEFGTVADADPVVAVNGQNVSFAARVGPFLNFNGLTVDADRLIVSQAVMDGPGFVVVQADDGTGNPGAILGEAPVNAGPNQNISIPFAPDSLTGTLYLALHQDTNQIGVFEAETVEGADNLLLINSQPVLGQTTLANVVTTTPATPVPADTSAENPVTTTGCAATIAGNVNLRSEPSTASEIVDVLTAGTSVSFVGVMQDAEGFNWWQTADGAWIRSDVVEALGDACATFVPATAP